MNEEIEYYGYIYKVTDLLNPHCLPNPIYIGQKKGNFNSEYYGSGTYIQRVVKKYGKENFKVEVIVRVSSKREANKQEIIQIRENDCIWPKGYNLAKGGDGHGGWSKGMTLGPYSKERRESCSKAHLGKSLAEMGHEPDCKCCICRATRHEPQSAEANEKRRKVVQSEEANEKRRIASRKLWENSEYRVRAKTKSTGKVWIHNFDSKVSKRVRPEEVQNYLDLGYQLGMLKGYRDCDIRSRICIHSLSLKVIRFVKPEKLQEYLNQGYKLGRLPHASTCKCISCTSRRDKLLRQQKEKSSET